MSELSPAHAAPLLDGGGLVQARVLVCTPSPQVALHCDGALQVVHPPFTETTTNNQKTWFIWMVAIATLFRKFEGLQLATILYH